MVSSLVSPSPLTRPATATDSTGNLTRTSTGASAGTSATWTSEQEARLAYCQDQLKQAQKKWSDRQELWIREVDHLLEQKRLYLKSRKTSNKEPSLRLWKRTRSWKALSRTQSAVDTTTCGKDGDGDEEGEREREGEEDGEDGEDGEEEEEGLALGKDVSIASGRDRGRGSRVMGVRRSESMPQAPSLSLSSSSFSSPTNTTTTTTTTTTASSSFSPPIPTSTASTTNFNPFKRIIRRMSTATGGGGGGGRRHSDSVAGAGAGEVL